MRLVELSIVAMRDVHVHRLCIACVLLAWFCMCIASVVIVDDYMDVRGFACVLLAWL